MLIVPMEKQWLHLFLKSESFATMRSAHSPTKAHRSDFDTYISYTRSVGKTARMHLCGGIRLLSSMVRSISTCRGEEPAVAETKLTRGVSVPRRAVGESEEGRILVVA